jgi:two-component system, OmpR family, sensor histidine kinase KdpD
MSSERADTFLRLIRRSQRGRLKIYLGYAAGVGKTYQMLQEAHRLTADGMDAVVGFIETHGRAETEALLDGLEVLPRLSVTYRGIVIEEMDLDAILSRRPKIVLVDELAHTNLPGSRNGKRYQDVEEILSAGIHVISTLNVQHLESLLETVEQVTGVKVHERIPDRIVSEADQLVNVDITTEDLRRRMLDGRIYSREAAAAALDHFFSTANLGHLRELTLREMAAQIDSQRRDLSSEELPSSPDQVMVCLSSRGPNTELMLRYASRLAGRLNRNWYALYVQTSDEHPALIDAATQRMLSNSLALAQQLGATVFTYRGDDIVKTILQFAREYRVGHIVIGSPVRRKSLRHPFRGRASILDRLVSHSQGMTIVVHDTKRGSADLPVPGSTRPERADRDPVRRKGLRLHGKAALSRGCILMWSNAIEKSAGLRQLLDACWEGSTEQKEIAWTALLAREEQGGTFVGEDAAIPHARIGDLHHVRIALGLSREGIYDTQYNREFRIMWLLLSPVDSPDSHVKALGAISRLTMDDQWRKKVLAARDSSEVIRLSQRLEELLRLRG